MQIWKQHEFDVATVNKGVRHKCSGAAGGIPGDASAGIWMFECKASELFKNRKSHTVHIDTWRKISHEARINGLLPAMVIRLQDNQGVENLYYVSEKDFTALNQELIELRNINRVATEPKISKSGRQAMSEDFDGVSLFYALRNYWLADQDKRKEEFKWQGNISPSAQIRPTTCVEAFFKRQKQYLEFPPDTLMIVNMGSVMHDAFHDTVLKVEGLRWEYPQYADAEIDAWQKKIEPEYACWDKESGIKGKIDDILNVDGEPVITDLKFRWMDRAAWDRFVKDGKAKIEHATQVRIYMNRLNAMKIYQERMQQGRISYCNMLMRPFSKGSIFEVPITYTKQDATDTNDLIEALWEGRMRELEGKPAICRNKKCAEHGSGKRYF